MPSGGNSKEFRCGFVAIIGRPNVGKSTLVNRLVGQKISIVTQKPQTTRNRIQGIVNRPGAQVILIDTPGLNEGGTALRRHMLQEIAQAMEGVDLLSVMLDASGPIGPGDKAVLQRANQFNGKAILLINKIDRVPKETLLPMMEACSRLREWVAIIPISARDGDGVESALKEFAENLPVGEPLFPLDQVTDQPERFLAGEIVREKAMSLTRQEVPHAIAAIVDSFEEKPKLTLIRVTLYVEQEGQKGILIGRGGEMLKHIGTAARAEIEAMLGVKVFLELHVKVQPGWRDNPAMVRQLDWRTQLEGLSELGDELNEDLDEAENLEDQEDDREGDHKDTGGEG
ncbi:MAG TPA: GTPase Era [Candidatus Acidoferrales bacterium]|nr:GTPase Era [Candidatus Acidoferrales bacterium]